MKKLKAASLSGSQNSYAAAVAIALVLAAALLIAYFVLIVPKQEGYTQIAILDSQRKALYPETVTVNSPFSLYVDVENHMGKDQNMEVQVKSVTGKNPTFPVNVTPTQTYDFTLKDGGNWENVTTLNYNSPGKYLTVFELWTQTENGKWAFTDNLVSLNIEVTPAA